MSKRKWLVIVSLYTLLAIVFTYPLIFKINQGIYGYSSDNFGLVWQLWWKKYAAQRHLPFSPASLVGAPQGTPFPALAGEPGWAYPLIWLTFLFNETIAFNLMVFSSFPLAGLTMFGLAFYLTKRVGPSFIAGLAYMLCPFHFWQLYAHLSLGLIQWLPLFVLGMLHFEQVRQTNSSRQSLVGAAILWGLSWVLITSFNVYYGYFTVLLAGAFYLANFLYQILILKKNIWHLPVGLWAFLVAGVVMVVGAIPVLVPMAAEQAARKEKGQAIPRPLEDVLSLSARPWDFLLPAPDQPFLGKWSDSMYTKIRSLSNDYKTMSAFLPERVVFLGWLPLALGVMGVTGGMRREKYRQLTWRFLFCFLVLLVVSAPPFIYFKGLRILFPSYFLYRLLPIFRVYIRLGIVLQVIVCLLGALGLSWLLQARWLVASRRGQIIIVGLAALIVMMEFVNIPPFHFTATDNPPQSYQWLKQQPGDFVVAEYPRAYEAQDALFWQRYHQKRLFNTLGTPDYYVKTWDEIEHLTSAEAPKVLATLGVRYVVWHFKDPVYNLFNPVDEPRWKKFSEPELEEGRESLPIVAKLSDAYIYEVRFPPTK